MIALTGQSVAVSPWIALPIAAVAMALVGWHASGLAGADMPRSRRRIRIANSWVMLLGIPLLAAGSSVIDPQRSPRAFVLVWLAVGVLLLLCVGLAVADALNTWRLAGAERRDAARATLVMLAASRAKRARGDIPPDRAQSTHDE